jgi:hypothetical protein
MARKKLRPPYPGIFMGSATALRKRPALAAEIAVVIGTWAEVEHMLGVLLADMLGKDTELGLAIFFALRSEGPQQEVIRAAAAKKLPLEIASMIDSFMRSLRDRAGARNDLAHGIWGTHEKHPDELLWMDRSASMEIFAWSRRPSLVDAKDLPIWRYSRDDLVEIADRSRDVLNEALELLRRARDHAE